MGGLTHLPIEILGSPVDLARSRPFPVEFGDRETTDPDLTVALESLADAGIAVQDELKAGMSGTGQLNEGSLALGPSPQEIPDLPAGAGDSQTVALELPPTIEDVLEMPIPETVALGSPTGIADQGSDVTAWEGRERRGSDLAGSTGPESVPTEEDDRTGENQRRSEDYWSLGIQREEVIGEESAMVEIPLEESDDPAESGETLIEITDNTGEEERTDEVESTREYVGDGSAWEDSATSVFREEPTTPPRNLQFSFDHYGTSPGFLNGSELLQVPHELLLRDQTTGMRTTSTTERESKQRSRASRKNRGVINRFSPE